MPSPIRTVTEMELEVKMLEAQLALKNGELLEQEREANEASAIIVKLVEQNTKKDIILSIRRNEFKSLDDLAEHLESSLKEDSKKKPTK